MKFNVTIWWILFILNGAFVLGDVWVYQVYWGTWLNVAAATLSAYEIIRDDKTACERDNI
jgi:hypothetical protein